MAQTAIDNAWGVIIKNQEANMPDGKEELGILQTQELMEALKAFVAEIKKAMADKKITFGEALGLFPEALAVIKEGKDYKLIMAEIKDLDGDEAKEILCDLVDTIFAVE